MMTTMTTPDTNAADRAAAVIRQLAANGHATLDDVRVLPVDRRTYGAPGTWAWDTHSELVALFCFTCAEVVDGYGDLTCDNDTCNDCGSEHTARAITNVAGFVLRGPDSLI